MAGNDQEGSRPSFTSFWRKGKEKLKGKDLLFVSHTKDAESASSASEQQTTPPKGEKELTAKEKAQIRRAQVRRAQIQHRQRKANYIQGLEEDVAQYRDMIAAVERESRDLATANKALRTTLHSGGVSTAHINVTQTQTRQNDMSQESASPMQLDSNTSPQTSYQDADRQDPNAAEPEYVPDMFSGIDVNDLTVTLVVDEILGKPCYQIKSNSSGITISSPASPESSVEGCRLSPEEAEVAINFILALEHTCWDHFAFGNCDRFAGHPKEDYEGHALTATSYCLSNVPDSIHDVRNAIHRQEDAQKKTKTPAALPTDSYMEWNAPKTISLDGLYGLANSLNPSDKELTPVQAWFELAEHYDIGVLLDPTTRANLKRELNGVVKCVHFGAIMERAAYESVIGRVLGPHQK